MSLKNNNKTDATTEEKIVEAARKLFTEKGFDAVKTRDIADEAGINLALLNYYFRSKKKLFEIITKENFGHFILIISEIVNDKKTSIRQKIEILVANYIDMFSINPDMPLFVLSHAKHYAQEMKIREKFMDSYFLKQVQKAIISEEIKPIDPTNLLFNIMGLTIFPFAGRHIFQNKNGITKEQFTALMQDRKKMIPIWIEAMLKAKS